jgi:hypothetical protein
MRDEALNFPPEIVIIAAPLIKDGGAFVGRR